MISEFHFLRPYWFFLLPFIVFLLWLYHRRKVQSRSWQAVCDPELLPYLLVGNAEGRKGRRVLFALALSSALALFALAGPAWKQLAQPVFRDQSALVLVLDLSRSMDAADIQPTRLTRARHKVIDILNTRREGLTALVVFAAEAFVVSPLTQDSETIASQITALNTALMPKQGSRPDRAMEKAGQLLVQASAPRGRILIITDGLENVPTTALKDALAELRQAGHSVYVLGVGTAEGAPVQLTEGGFLKDQNGAIVLPKLDEAGLVSLAQEGGGAYARLSVDDQDLRFLLAENPISTLRAQTGTTDFKSDRWREEGPWLLLPLLPIAALAFRRGFFVFILWTLLAMAQPVQAFDWESLWSRPDQRGARTFEEGKAEAAAKIFEDPQWKAASHYRAGQYQQSIETLSGIESADAYYNKGNALAKLGRVPEAIAAYDEALKRAPEHEDALYNKTQLQKLSEEQKQENGQDGEPSEGEEGEQSEEAGQNSSQSPPQDQANNEPGDAQPDQDGRASDEQQSDQDADDARQAERAENKKEGEEERDAEEAKREEAEENKEGETPSRMAQAESQEQDESQQANEQWLRRIPDDPGGLLRRKFLFQSKQGRGAKHEDAAW